MNLHSRQNRFPGEADIGAWHMAPWLMVACVSLLASVAHAGEGTAHPSPAAATAVHAVAAPATAHPAHPAAPSAPLPDERLDAGEPVYGVMVGDLPRAYVMADLAKAGPVVHDLVAEQRIDVVVEGTNLRVTPAGEPARVVNATAWGTWSHQHPDTSIWRRAAIGEAEAPRDGREIHLGGSHDYRTALGCTFGCEAVEGEMTSRPREHPGVFVISGELTNKSGSPVHHVVLLYELVDGQGRVVYREEGFNRAAESLAETDQQSRTAPPPAVAPIAPGASDGYRMLFLDRELPPFHHTRVVVSRVY